MNQTKLDKKRAIILIIDGCGVGAAPDANIFGDDSACNSLANTSLKVGGLDLPSMGQLGLGNITNIKGLPNITNPLGFYGKLQEKSNGKDTQTGHWELMGLISSQGFPTYPHGFPRNIIDEFIQRCQCGNILGNKPASGTDIIEELGPEHQQTGYPIIYTSGDSVFQIACHVDTVPLDRLYQWCHIARDILQGEHQVGRVIARPFNGVPGSYRRLQGDRRDLAIAPPAPTLLDHLSNQGFTILGIGKIEDIFVGRGITEAIHTANNTEGLKLTLAAVSEQPLDNNFKDRADLIFTNLVDTDSMYGHRRDAQGYAQALKEIDKGVQQIINAMQPYDLLIITSDHGNDPTHRGTDHTREYVPLLIYSPQIASMKLKTDTGTHDLGVRNGFMDIAATLANWFGLPWAGLGKSCLH